MISTHTHLFTVNCEKLILPAWTNCLEYANNFQLSKVNIDKEDDHLSAITQKGLTKYF